MISSLPKSNSLNGRVLFSLMDGIERSPREVCVALNIDLATAITARIRDLRKERFGGFYIPKIPRKVGDKVVNFYRLVISEEERVFLKVYKFVSSYPSMTFYEIAALLDVDCEKTSKILWALERMGRASHDSGRECSVVGWPEHVWRAA